MNRFTQTKVHTGGVRPVSLLLMVIFTVCAFALMWAAVGCLDRISESSSDAVTDWRRLSSLPTVSAAQRGL